MQADIISKLSCWWLVKKLTVFYVELNFTDPVGIFPLYLSVFLLRYEHKKVGCEELDVCSSPYPTLEVTTL